jgi:hypothetical protein
MPVSLPLPASGLRSRKINVSLSIRRGFPGIGSVSQEPQSVRLTGNSLPGAIRGVQTGFPSSCPKVKSETLSRQGIVIEGSGEKETGEGRCNWQREGPAEQEGMKRMRGTKKYLTHAILHSIFVVWSFILFWPLTGDDVIVSLLSCSIGPHNFLPDPIFIPD